MTQQEVYQRIAGILSALREEAEPVPAVSVYMALDMDLYVYELIATVMKQAGLIKLTRGTIMLTDEGRKKAAEVDEFIEKQKGK